MTRLAVAGGSVIAGLVIGIAVVHRDHSAPVAHPDRGPYRGSEPPGSIYAPAFTLPSYRGVRVSVPKPGKVVVLSFVDTSCKESCPVVTSAIARAYRLLTPKERRQVVPLLVTVDPRTDTPQHVRPFLERRHALAVDYLIGTVRQLRPVWKAYFILPAIDTGNADVHSSDVRIFDRRSLWVATQHAGVDLNSANLVHDVRTALAPGG